MTKYHTEALLQQTPVIKLFLNFTDNNLEEIEGNETKSATKKARKTREKYWKRKWKKLITGKNTKELLITIKN